MQNESALPVRNTQTGCAKHADRQCHPIFQEILSKFEVKNCEANDKSENEDETKNDKNK